MDKDTIDAMVEAAAQALNEGFSDEFVPWDDISEETRDMFRRDARAAVFAAVGELYGHIFRNIGRATNETVAS